MRGIRYQFNSTDCSVDTVTDESDTDTSKQLRTAFGYDGYGNVALISQYSVGKSTKSSTSARCCGGKALSFSTFK